MVQGTLLQVWPVRQPVLGSIGELELIVLKDRPGQVRKNAGRISGRAQVAAKVTIDSTGTQAGPATIITVATPANAGNPSAPVKPSGSMQLDLTTGAAFKKLELQEARDKLFLSAFDNTLGLALSQKEIASKIGPTWNAMKWTKTAFITTRDRLLGLDPRHPAYISKTGGERGPNVKYVLDVVVGDGDDGGDGDSSQSATSD
jgi:hypothetical protein